MGTRADFYIGTGENAEWLGSVAWDGYEWYEDKGCPLMKATNEEEYRAALKKIAKDRDDWTNPDQGWPWPWKDSGTTDYVYYFDSGKVSAEDRHDWPNMEDRQNVTYGKRSGVILFGG